MPSTEYVIVCSQCGAEVKRETEPQGDQSTFTCDVCQDIANLPAYQQEKDELMAQGDALTASQKVRVGFLNGKIERATEAQKAREASA